MIKNSSSLLAFIKKNISKSISEIWDDMIRLDVLTQVHQSDEELNEINHINNEVDILRRKLKMFAPSDVFDLLQKIDILKDEILDLQSRFQN